MAEAVTDACKSEVPLHAGRWQLGLASLRLKAVGGYVSGVLSLIPP